MGERPILFSAPMVRALLAGRKTQTRRVVKPQPVACDHRDFNPGTPMDATWSPDGGWHCSTCGNGVRGHRHCFTGFPCPYGAPGDTLWVREAWCESDTPTGAAYRADAPLGSDQRGMGWRPSIHMPRWASRITLTITDVRVERLQEISDGDAEAEGCPPCPRCHDVGWINSGPDGGWQCDAPGCGAADRDQYQRLWNHINGAGAWDANPFVWAVSFDRALTSESNPHG